MFDGKEFQFDATNLAPDVWHLALICPTGRNMKITDIYSGLNTSYPFQNRVSARITRAANSQIVGSHFSPFSTDIKPIQLLLSTGDTLEVLHQNGNAIGSVSIHGMLN